MMFLTVLVFILIEASIQGLSVPSRHFVTREMVESPLTRDIPKRTTNLAGKYSLSLYNRDESLKRVLANGDAFHTDALIFALLDTSSNIHKIENTRVDMTESDSPDMFSFSEYESLLEAVMDETGPGIHSRFINASVLAELSDLYLRNYEIIYLPEVFDPSTFDRVCRLSQIYM